MEYIGVLVLVLVIVCLLKLVKYFCERYWQRVPEIREHPEKPELQTWEDELEEETYEQVYKEPTPVAENLKNVWEVYHKLKAQENLSKLYERLKKTWESQNLKVPEGLIKDYEHLQKMLDIPTSKVGLTETGTKENEYINKMWQLLDSNILKTLSEKCTIKQFINDNTLVMIPDNAGNDEYIVLWQPSEEVDTIEEEDEGSTNTRLQVVYKDVVVFRVNHGMVSAFLELCSPETINEDIEEQSIEHFKNQICSEGDYRLFSDAFPELKEAFLELRSPETTVKENEEPSVEHFKNQICSEGDLPSCDSFPETIAEVPSN
uniref:Uncharacterized protein n=1 Tax=Cuerna arida TaxID=1464854 RepID=A0A1B6ER78_9HEMI